MQEATTRDAQINKDLTSPLFRPPRAYWIAVVVLGIVVLGFFSAFGFMMNRGLGVTGLNRPVFWAFLIPNFVFWVGISHAGVMLSAILRLSKAEWRRPATRAAEVLTILALSTAVLMPVFHTGRPWRIVYWALPYDFARGIWPNIRSPLIWDPAAIGSYLTGSALFVYTALLPDIAVARDRSKGVIKKFYAALSLGWRGTARQWKLQAIAGILLSALILPVFVSVHSIVSWDFGVAASVKGWHSTIFAPYFVIGAVHSGVAAVVTAMILLRHLFNWKTYIRPEHMDALGKLLIVVATTWFFFFALEFIFGLYGREGDEIALKDLLIFQMPWNALFFTFLFTAYFFPVSLWLFKRVRLSMPLMLITTISVNIGMWLERFLIITPGLATKQEFSFVWNTYAPSPVEITIVVGTFALVGLGVLMFAKLFPLIPLYDIKEHEVLKGEIQVGKKKVPAVFREQ